MSKKMAVASAKSLSTSARDGPGHSCWPQVPRFVNEGRVLVAIDCAHLVLIGFAILSVKLVLYNWCLNDGLNGYNDWLGVAHCEIFASTPEILLETVKLHCAPILVTHHIEKCRSLRGTGNHWEANRSGNHRQWRWTCLFLKRTMSVVPILVRTLNFTVLPQIARHLESIITEVHPLLPQTWKFNIGGRAHACAETPTINDAKVAKDEISQSKASKTQHTQSIVQKSKDVHTQPNQRSEHVLRNNKCQTSKVANDPNKCQIVTNGCQPPTWTNKN